MRTLLLSLFTLTVSLSAQSSPVACEGRMATVRVSVITPTGTSKGFLEAVAAHKAWLQSHGMAKDEVITVPVIVRDEATKVRSYSNTQFWSMHIHGTAAGPEAKHDEAYDAFVKLYRENSDIQSAYDVCLPASSLK